MGQDQAMCWWDDVDGKWIHDASRWVHEQGLRKKWDQDNHVVDTFVVKVSQSMSKKEC